MADDVDATVRAAAAAITATLNKSLSDPAAQSILLTRDEALLALGIVEGVVEQLDSVASRDGALQ